MDTLIEKINRVYDRLERDDNNGVSRYNSVAMNDETLFALALSYVVKSGVRITYDEYGQTIATPDGATYDEVLAYANDRYGYEVCARCDSDICQHVNN